MLSDRETLNLRSGMDVFGSDDGKVGSVADVQGQYVVVNKGFFFPKDFYIPVDAINTADSDGVYLNVTKDAALNQGWDTEPADVNQASFSNGSGYAGKATSTSKATARNQATQATDGLADGRKANRKDADTIRVPLSEEELTASKRTVDRGAVHVNKVVSESEQTLEVPVTEERVNLSRRVVDRDVAPGDTTFQETTIDIPVHGEEVDVQKNARVREELEISRDAVQDTKRVSGKVRKEEARIQDDTGTVVQETGSNSRKATRK
jgi:uncharacterized protein (TIGR02271 family)